MFFVFRTLSIYTVYIYYNKPFISTIHIVWGHSSVSYLSYDFILVLEIYKSRFIGNACQGIVGSSSLLDAAPGSTAGRIHVETFVEFLAGANRKSDGYAAGSSPPAAADSRPEVVFALGGPGAGKSTM